MLWFWLLLIVLVIGGVIGYFITGRSEEGAIAGGCLAGGGCLYVLIKIFIIAVIIMGIMYLAHLLFGMPTPFT